MKILKQQTAVKSLTLMVQKEVALRLCADERSRDNGAVSLAVRYYSKPNLLFFVPSDNFMPRPKVDSAVIRLDILDKPAVRADDEQFLFKVIKACFSQRRKTLVNSLCATLEFDKAFIENCLIEMGKDKKIRGEQLSLEEYCLLCKKMLKL